MALETSPEQPAPVREVSQRLSDWLNRLGAVWVEGEVSEINRRQGMSYLTLRDLEADLALSVSMTSSVLDSSDTRIDEGMRIIVHAKAQWWGRRGSVSFRADEVRAVGVGALLAQIERTRQQLLAEGLLDPRRKQALPFLPTTVGLICGANSDAERDVITNARNRWPAAQFEVRHVMVQGPQSAGQVRSALAELDANPDVDVIVITRGGGSVEDLLSFSDEALCRAVAAANTPVVSAIGHEADHPLLDDVADVRASTPTDAARRVVPDVEEQRTVISNLRQRTRSFLEQFLAHEHTKLTAVRSRPCLAAPDSLIAEHLVSLARARETSLRLLVTRMKHADEQLGQTLARLRGLSPAQTLARGYAIITGEDGRIVRTKSDVHTGSALQIRVSDGSIGATAD
ncbi:MAG: exodeoxyribonuclease VII large subunit [Actinobacteria bacterium]|nr:exodeoxyribonuclease VII large subunit [Actinomycetota bacterium]